MSDRFGDFITVTYRKRRSRTRAEACHCGAKPGEKCISYRSKKRMTYFHDIT